jgi:hypothetical protein
VLAQQEEYAERLVVGAKVRARKVSEDDKKQQRFAAQSDAKAEKARRHKQREKALLREKYLLDRRRERDQIVAAEQIRTELDNEKRAQASVRSLVYCAAVCAAVLSSALACRSVTRSWRGRRCRGSIACTSCGASSRSSPGGRGKSSEPPPRPARVWCPRRPLTPAPPRLGTR